jgi:hypothetical protein
MFEFLKKEVPIPKLKLPVMPKLPAAPQLDIGKMIRKCARWFLPTTVMPGQLWQYNERVMQVKRVAHGSVCFIYNYPHLNNEWRADTEALDYFKMGSRLIRDVE